jgi:hypothetical protein
MPGLDLTSIIVTGLTLLGGQGAWNYYQRRLEFRIANERKDKDDKNLFRDDLRERVAILEDRLENERRQNDDLHLQIAELKSKMMEYIVRLEYLEKENLRLRTKAGEL